MTSLHQIVSFCLVLLQITLFVQCQQAIQAQTLAPFLLLGRNQNFSSSVSDTPQSDRDLLLQNLEQDQNDKNQINEKKLEQNDLIIEQVGQNQSTNRGLELGLEKDTESAGFNWENQYGRARIFTIPEPVIIVQNTEDQKGEEILDTRKVPQEEIQLLPVEELNFLNFYELNSQDKPKYSQSPQNVSWGFSSDQKPFMGEEFVRTRIVHAENEDQSKQNQLFDQIDKLEDEEAEILVGNSVPYFPPYLESTDLEEDGEYYDYTENYQDSQIADQQMLARSFFFVHESGRTKIVEDQDVDSKSDEDSAQIQSSFQNSDLRNGFSNFKNEIQDQFVASRIVPDSPRKTPVKQIQLSPNFTQPQFSNQFASSNFVQIDQDQDKLSNIQTSPINLNLNFPPISFPQPSPIKISPIQLNIPQFSLPPSLQEFGSSRILKPLPPVIISIPEPQPQPQPSPVTLTLPPSNIPPQFQFNKDTVASNFKPIPSIFDTRPSISTKLENEILTKIYSTGKFNKFLSLLDQSGSLEGLFPKKTSLFTENENQLQFTMLAPTDQAFDDFFNWMTAMGYKKTEQMFEDWEYMGLILGYHIISENVLESKDFKNFTVLKTLQGSEIVALLDGEDDQIRIHDSCIDQPTKSGHTCNYEARWGKCFDDFMVDSGGAGWRGGYCQRTCKRCSCSKDSDWPCSVVASPDIVNTADVVVHGISRVLFPMNPRFIQSLIPSKPNFAQRKQNIKPQPYAFHPIVRAGTMPRDEKSLKMISDGWRIGRGTHYGWHDGGSIHIGSCMYGYLCPNKGTGWDIAALADVYEDYQDSCGTCYEVRCNPMEVYDLWGQKDMRYQGICHDEDASVVVTITDTCPCIYPKNYYSNMRWCCGDMDHMDLSIWAFEKLSAAVDKGVIGLWYRRVACDYKPQKTAKLPYRKSKYEGQKPHQYNAVC